MNTLFLVIAKFESATIPLEEVAPKYLNINNDEKYKRMVTANLLPIAFFRATKSRKRAFGFATPETWPF